MARKPGAAENVAAKQVGGAQSAPSATSKPSPTKPQAAAKRRTAAQPKTAPAATPALAVSTVGARKPAARAPAEKPAAAASPPSAAAAPRESPPAETDGDEQGHAITPEQALANTRQLLEAKQERDRQPAAWQQLDPGHGQVPRDGPQSPSAAAKAEELHAGESRMQAIQGSIGTQDRHNQGKRDNR
nr:hypothetical protein [Lysobacter silvisoli]